MLRCLSSIGLASELHIVKYVISASPQVPKTRSNSKVAGMQSLKSPSYLLNHRRFRFHAIARRYNRIHPLNVRHIFIVRPLRFSAGDVDILDRTLDDLDGLVTRVANAVLTR